MLSPYGSSENITGVYALLDRWCAQQVKAHIAATRSSNGGTAGGFYMPSLAGDNVNLASEEQCYQLAWAGQRGCYAMWAVAGITVQIYGGRNIVVGPIDCEYVTDGWGCSTNPGGLCLPYIPPNGTRLVDVPLPGRLYTTSSQDDTICPVADLYEMPTLWVLAEQQPGRPGFRGEISTWRAIELIEDDGSLNPDQAWGELSSQADTRSNPYYGDMVGGNLAPPDEQWAGNQ